MLTVSHDELEAALAACDAPVGASEAHGSLCGALAAVPGFSAEDWADAVLPDDGGDAAELRSRNLLETLYAETEAALAGQMMQFEPLLPDDDEPLERRVTALAAWCAGFLYGLGSGGVAATGDDVPEDVQEVARDFSEISRAAVGGEETEESNEGSYAEIVEYLRAGTQLVYEELAAHRAAGGES